MKLDKSEIKVYNYINNVIDTFMANYNYNLVIGNVYSKKYYLKDTKKVVINNDIDDDVEKAELISLGFNIFSFLIMDVELFLSKNNNISNILEELLINSTSNIDSDTLKWVYKYNDEVLGSGDGNELIIYIDKLINIVKDNLNEESLNEVIDVNIISSSTEEDFYALRIAQNLRLNDVKCSINENIDSTFTIKLDEDKLKLGILNVTDNRTEDVIRLDEVEIVDYILSNL